MKPGDLDRRITLLQPGQQTGTDDFGHPVFGPPLSVTVWAKRVDASDGEQVAAGQLGSHLMSRFVVRASPVLKSLTPQAALTHDGATWNIKGVKETQDGRNRFLEITAVRDLDV